MSSSVALHRTAAGDFIILPKFNNIYTSRYDKPKIKAELSIELRALEKERWKP